MRVRRGRPGRPSPGARPVACGDAVQEHVQPLVEDVQAADEQQQPVGGAETELTAERGAVQVAGSRDDAVGNDGDRPTRSERVQVARLDVGERHPKGGPP